MTGEFPELCISTSAEVLPFMREYERFTTTSINAYVQPMVDRYLKGLESGLAQQGFGGDLYITSSNAGTVTAATARRFPVRIMESGPAAGALMATHVGAMLGLPNLLSYDTGGTTSKGCLILDGKLPKAYELETARVHEFKKGSGLTVKAPVADMIEIGAGGGSIAEIDERGLLRVGPQSAGADPGPACYGRGGEEATLTDADLVLGYLDAEFFLGGSMRLDLAAAKRTIMENVGYPLGLELTEAAWGIHETINENCARAFRMHASERMVDYRNCTMVAFGGSAPIRAVRVARKLKIPRIVLPMGAGVFSAFGLLISPLAFDALRTRRVSLDELTPTRFADEFRSPTAEALGFLRQAAVEESAIRLTRSLDMRYRGQGFEIEVKLPDASDPADLFIRIPELFSQEYERVFSSSFSGQPVEIVNWKVEAKGPTPVIEGAYRPREEVSAGSELKGERPVFVSDTPRPAPALHPLPQRLIHDAKCRHVLHHPLRARHDSGTAFAGLGITRIAQTSVDELAAVELIVEDPEPQLAITADGRRVPNLALRPRHAFRIQNQHDLARTLALVVEPEDPAHGLRLPGLNLAQPPRHPHPVRLDPVRRPVTVGDGHHTALAHPRRLAPARLRCERCHERFVDHALEPDVYRIDFTLLHRVQIDVSIAKLPVQARHVRLVAAQPVERLGNDRIEAPRPRVLEHLAKPLAPMHGRSGEGGIGVHRHHHAAHRPHPPAAQPHLVLDGERIL